MSMHLMRHSLKWQCTFRSSPPSQGVRSTAIRARLPACSLRQAVKLEMLTPDPWPGVAHKGVAHSMDERYSIGATTHVGYHDHSYRSI